MIVASFMPRRPRVSPGRGRSKSSCGYPLDNRRLRVHSLRMEREPPFHVKSRLPGRGLIGLIVGLMAFVVFITWLVIALPINLSVLQPWQTLISATVAAIGVVAAAAVAVRNVSRQIRINILLREEDRIDKQLPGLRTAAHFLEGFNSAETTVDFYRLGVGKSGSKIEKDVEEALPATDDTTRARVLNCLLEAYQTASSNESMRRFSEAAERAKAGDPEAWKALGLNMDNIDFKPVSATTLDYNKVQLAEKLKRIQAEVANIKGRIARYEHRRTRIREEIERYFGD
jgi:hypothetical protein